MARAIGLLLILVGIIGLAWGGMTYNKTQKAVDLGRIKTNTPSRKSIPVPPFAGSVALLAGISLIGIPKSR